MTSLLSYLIPDVPSSVLEGAARVHMIEQEALLGHDELEGFDSQTGQSSLFKEDSTNDSSFKATIPFD